MKRGQRSAKGWWMAPGVSVCLTLLLGPGVASGAAGYDWKQFAESGWSGVRGGSNTQEGVISSSNVDSLTQLFQVSLPNVADGAAAYLRAVTVDSSSKDLLFLTTTDGHIVAIDGHSGATVWSKQNGSGSCTDTNGSTRYTTPSPAIDPDRQYVYTYGLGGYVHKLRVGPGAEVTGGGWPEPVTLKSSQEKTSLPLV